MSIVIDTTEQIELKINPETVVDEVLQNLWFLYSSIEYDVPLNRAFGLNATYLDKPIETAKALAMSDIFEKTELYEPRAEIVDITFKVDYERGIIKPIVEVRINEEYNEEEYTG